MKQPGIDAVHFKRHFSKPADMRTNPPAAVASGRLARRFISVRVFKRRAATGIAAAFEELSVHVDYIFRAGLLVQIIDILRADEQTVPESGFELRESRMCWIWFGDGSHAPAHGIKLPYELRIAPPSERRSDLFDAVIAPEAIDATESGNSAFRADAGTGQDKDRVCGGEL